MSAQAVVTHRDPAIQLAEKKQHDGSGRGARGRLGGPRQCLRVDILPDVRQFAISNGNGEDPMVLERLIHSFDSSPSEVARDGRRHCSANVHQGMVSRLSLRPSRTHLA